MALIKGIPAAKDWSHEGELYAISQLHRFGLPYGSDLSFVESFPCNCSKCRGVVIPLCQQETMPNEVKLRLWMDHTSKCGGSNDNHKAHNELNSLIIKAVCGPHLLGASRPVVQGEGYSYRAAWPQTR